MTELPEEFECPECGYEMEQDPFIDERFSCPECQYALEFEIIDGELFANEIWL